MEVLLIIKIQFNFAVKQKCFSFYGAVQFLKNLLWDRHLFGSRAAQLLVLFR